MNTKLTLLPPRVTPDETAHQPAGTYSASGGTSVALERAWPKHLLTSIPFWFVFGAVGAAFLAWDSRLSMSQDGLSYYDMASETIRSGPSNLINLLWSPLYPSLIALSLFLFRPSASAEIPLIHVVNWLIFLGVSLAFAFLVRTWFVEKQDSTPNAENAARQGILVPFAFWLFFWSMIHFIPVSLVSPDLCVEGVVFLAAGICSQLPRPTSNWKNDLALGGTLALGYYAKAAMFPLALLLLFLLFLWPPSGSRGRYGVLVTVVVFLLFSAPLIFVMSNRVGHLSTGGSGSLNYAWWVNKVPPYGGSIRMEMSILDSLYTGKLDTSNGLTHPPRILMEKPLILEFRSPVNGTYPLWYDPCYWNKGAEARFNLRQQMIALKENLLRYGHALIEMSTLFAGLLVFSLLRLNRRMPVKPDRGRYWLLLWSLAAAAMYAFVHVEYRFLGGFFVLFWLAAYRFMLGTMEKGAEKAILATVLGSLVVSTIGGGELLHHTTESQSPDYLRIAEGLRTLGIKPGDELATIGYTFDAYYAHAAGTRIIAQIPEADEFWGLSAEERERVKEHLLSIGTKALVAKDGPRGVGYADWQEIPGTHVNRVRVLLLEPSSKIAVIPGAKRDGASSELDTAAPRSR